MAWHRARGVDAYRLAATAGIRRVRRGVGADVAALSLVCECRADVLQLRLGNAAARERLPRNLSRRLGHGTERVADLDISLAAVPRHVRCGADQDPRRRLLAGLDMSELL